MPLKDLKNILFYFSKNNLENNKPNKVYFETFINKGNNIEQNYLPLIDIDLNRKILNNKLLNNSSNPDSDSELISTIKNDNISNIYIIGLSFLGLYILNLINKKR